MRHPTRSAYRLLLSVAFLLLAGCTSRPAPPSLAVGTTTDAQSVILAHVYAGALRGSGAAVHVQSAVDPLAELDAGTLAVLPGLTGRLLATFAPAAEMRSDKQVYRAMVGVLPEGIAAGDYATAAADKPALAVTDATATRWGSTHLAAVARRCDELSVGAVAGARTPLRVGRCQLPRVHEFPSENELFDALGNGRVAAAWTSTADPDTPDGLVVLSDDKRALIRAENVVPLYRRNELAEPQVLALNQVAGVLDTAALIDMRRKVADGAEPQAVADAWLSEHPLGR